MCCAVAVLAVPSKTFNHKGHEGPQRFCFLVILEKISYLLWLSLKLRVPSCPLWLKPISPCHTAAAEAAITKYPLAQTQILARRRPARSKPWLSSGNSCRRGQGSPACSAHRAT